MNNNENNDASRIRELIQILNEANEAYYGDGEEIMSNKEYDDLYDELTRLERETGIIMSGSPTQEVGHNIATKLPKGEHEKPMLSLSKTKSVEELASFVSDRESYISWKMDGLTVVLTYEGGKLVRGLTRGNGTIGEVITDNVKQFKNIPLNISCKERLIVRGEAIIKYSDFNKINEKLPLEEQYKNPRNLCSGSIRQLDSKITGKRNVYFYAYTLVSAENIEFENKKSNMLKFLSSQGFDTVEYKMVSSSSEVSDTVEYYREKIKTYDLPSDGLVVTYDDIEYSNSLGLTNKFPRDSIAFKWQDETKETTLRDVIWSPSRTGLINPVAVFDSVELEGTTVKQASCHNVSIVKSLELGYGDTIKVFKANMIIPQILDNITRSNTIKIPDVCPACFGIAKVRKINDSEALYCTNNNCIAKSVKYMEHFVSKNCANIEGISEKVIEKFLNEKIIENVIDLYKIEEFKERIISLDGFGDKSYEKFKQAIDSSRNMKLANFINALGIQDVGFASSKLLSKHYKNIDALMNAEIDEIMQIDGFGEVTAKNIYEYFRNDKLREMVEKLKKEIHIQEVEEIDLSESTIADKVFVITGKVNYFENRDALKEKIESLGGKTTNKVTSKTDYLINNDINSTSSKNKDAKASNVPIITEDQFLEMIGEK